MKALSAFLAVNALFVLANVFAAGTALALGALVKESALHDAYWAWVLVAFATVAVGVASAIGMGKLISRQRG